MRISKFINKITVGVLLFFIFVLLNADVEVLLIEPSYQLGYDEDVTLSVDVRGLTEAMPMRAFEINISYDTNYFSADLSDLQQGNFLSNSGSTQWFVTGSNGNYTATCSILGVNTGSSGSGTLFTLFLTNLNNDMTLGTEVTLPNVILKDPLNNVITVDTIGNCQISEEVQVLINEPSYQLGYDEDVTLSVDVRGITEAMPMRAFEINISYDTNYFSADLSDLQQGNFLSNSGSTQWFVTGSNGNYTATCSILGVNTGSSGSGTLFTLFLTNLNNDMTLGTEVTLPNVILKDPLNNVITVDTIGNCQISEEVQVLINEPSYQLGYDEDVTLSVDVRGITEAMPMRAFEINISYDTNYFSADLSDLQQGNFLSNSGSTQWFVTGSNGNYTATCSILGVNTGSSGSGTLFTLFLTNLNNDMTLGTEVTLPNVILKDPLNNEIIVDAIGNCQISEEVQVFINEPSYQLGYDEDVTLSVDVRGITEAMPMRAFEINISYDTNYFSADLTDLQEGDFLSNSGDPALWHVTGGNGDYTVTCSIMGVTSGSSGSGTLFTLFLTNLNNDMTLGTEVTLSNVILKGLMNNEIEVETIGNCQISEEVQVLIIEPSYRLVYDADVTLSVYVEGLSLFQSMRAFEINISYDTNYFSADLTDLQQGDFLSNSGSTQWFVTGSNGNYTATCSILGVNTGSSGSGILFTLSLTNLNNEITSGTEVTLPNVILKDPLNNEITVETIGNCHISIDDNPSIDDLTIQYNSGTDKIELHWTYPTSVDHFNVYRSTDPYDFSGATVFTTNTVSYSEPATGTRYFYRVTADR